METEKTALPASREEKMAHLLGVKKGQYTFDDLVMIMELLRGEGGCPWDREQDHHSIRNDFIEETYEAVEAIDKDDPVHLREELGDVLLQVVFHARIEDEAGRFDVYDVTNDICEKLIYRHPHVFGKVHVENSQEVLTNWDALKGVEKRAERVTLTDTLRSIRQTYPDAELWLLMGTDMFLTLHLWHEPEVILSLAGVCAFGRTEQDGEAMFAPQRDYLQQHFHGDLLRMA